MWKLPRVNSAQWLYPTKRHRSSRSAPVVSPRKEQEMPLQSAANALCGFISYSHTQSVNFLGGDWKKTLFLRNRRFLETTERYGAIISRAQSRQIGRAPTDHRSTWSTQVRQSKPEAITIECRQSICSKIPQKNGLEKNTAEIFVYPVHRLSSASNYLAGSPRFEILTGQKPFWIMEPCLGFSIRAT